MMNTCARVALSTLAVLCCVAATTHADTIYIYNTINVPAGATYDGYGNTYVAVGMGNGTQSESQSPFFRTYANAWLKNVKLAAPGVDGCHFYGNGTMNEVTWQDVGEDAFTVKSGGNCWVSGGSAAWAADKCGQVNSPTWLTLFYLYTYDVRKVVRQNGGSTYQCNFYFDHNTANITREAIGRTDSSSTTFGMRGMNVQNFWGSRGWWYGRDHQSFWY